MKKFVLPALLFCAIAIFAVLFSLKGSSVSLPSTSISLTMAVTKSGQVVQEIDFSAQSENLKNLGLRDDQIYEIKNNLLSCMDSLRNQFYLSFLMTYSLSPNPDFKISENLAISEAYFDQQSDVVGFKIVFKSLQAFSYFHGGGDGANQRDDQLLGKNVVKFISRTSSESLFPFAAKYTDNVGRTYTIGQRYLTLYQSSFNTVLTDQQCKSLQAPKFVYDYAIPFANVRTNCDAFVQTNDLCHNIWIRDLSNYQDCTVKLTSTVIYSGWWYLTILLVVIFALGIVLVLLKVKNKL